MRRDLRQKAGECHIEWIKTMSDNKDLLQRLEDAKEALARLERGETPSAAELASAPQIDFWYLTEHGLVLALGGVVTGHPNLADGAHVCTSALLWIADDKKTARTLSRFYRLGVPLEDALATKH